MAYELVKNGNTEFAVDWSIIERLTMSYHRAYYQYDLSTVSTNSESTWYNPFSWSLPDVKNLDVPWESVREYAAKSTERDMEIFRRDAQKDMRTVARDVNALLPVTSINKRHFTDKMKAVQLDNAAAIDKAVSDYDSNIDTAKTVRNAAADIVGIGATIATGGAGAALLAGSSSLKAVGKYQDTGNIGAAALYGTGSFMLGAFKLDGVKLSKAGDYVLIVFQGALESSTSLLAGDSVSKATKDGVLKIASASGAQAVFNSPVVKEAIKKIPVPFSVMVGDKNVAGSLLEKSLKKFVAEKGFKAAGSAAWNGAANLINGSNGSGGSNGAVSAGPPRVIDEAMIYDQQLLGMAVVNMQLGIGRGW